LSVPIVSLPDETRFRLLFVQLEALVVVPDGELDFLAEPHAAARATTSRARPAAAAFLTRPP